MTEVARNLTQAVPVELKVGGADRDVLLDESLLRHILVNLLGNAIKYSPSQASVGFEVQVGADSAVFRVRDRGIGIPAADLPKLFESFFRARNVGNIGGTGLGLAIAKRLVEAHGGSIEATAPATGGTTIRFAIPAR